jgi:hypothetical protein
MFDKKNAYSTVWLIDRENLSARRKPCPIATSFTTSPIRRAPAGNSSFGCRSQLLIAWNMARSSPFIRFSFTALIRVTCKFCDRFYDSPSRHMFSGYFCVLKANVLCSAYKNVHNFFYIIRRTVVSQISTFFFQRSLLCYPEGGWSWFVQNRTTYPSKPTVPQLRKK